MNILWRNRKIYQRVLLIVAIISILGVLPYFIEFIAACINLNNAIAANVSYADNPLQYQFGLVGIGAALLFFFNSIGKLFFPLMFTVTCFIFTFLNIKSKNSEQTKFTNVVEKTSDGEKQSSISPIIIEPNPLENYTPSSSVRFTIPENKKIKSWDRTVEYYKIPSTDVDKIKNKNLYCKSIDDKHGSLFAEQTHICNLYATTHSDYLRNFGNEYRFDCCLLNAEPDFNDESLIKLSIQIYIPKLIKIE